LTIFILGDYHGQSIQPFIQEENPSSEDKIFSLGDFDEVEVIREYLDLRDEIGSQNVVEVGGNHDYWAHNGWEVASRGTKTSEELLEEYQRDELSQDYFEDLLNQVNTEFEIDGMNGILSHAGLTGLVRNPDLPDEAKEFVYRIWEEEHFEQNFEIMAEKELDLMVRAHEHYTEHAFSPNYSEKISWHLPEPGDEYRIDPDYKHIITNGAWMDGEYAKINPETKTISFEKINL